MQYNICVPCEVVGRRRGNNGVRIIEFERKESRYDICRSEIRKDKTDVVLNIYLDHIGA